jgi:hypothetical protein
MKPVLTVLRSRIRVGSSETLSVQTCQCPRCEQTVCLMWPEYILHIPSYRVVTAQCSGCTAPFSLIAIDLIPMSDSETLFSHAVVLQLS